MARLRYPRSDFSATVTSSECRDRAAQTHHAICKAQLRLFSIHSVFSKNVRQNEGLVRPTGVSGGEGRALPIYVAGMRLLSKNLLFRFEWATIALLVAAASSAAANQVNLAKAANVTSFAAFGTPITVKVGDPSIDASFIRPYSTKWKVMGRAPDGSVVQMGIWTDATRVDTINGREVLLRRQAWIYDKGAEGYYNIVDHKTMAPVLSQHASSDGFYRRMEFGRDGKSVRYQMFLPPPPAQGKPMKMSAPMRQGVIKLKRPCFDFNTGMFGLLIAGFPLKEGYAARFPVFRSYDPKAQPAWVDFEVKGKETVPAGIGKTMETWLVVVHSPDTGEVITLNLAKQAPYVIQLRQPWAGRDWTFEMIDVTTPTPPLPHS